MKNLEWEAEVLAQRFAAVQAERDSLYEKFEASVYDVAQKTGEQQPYPDCLHVQCTTRGFAPCQWHRGLRPSAVWPQPQQQHQACLT